MPKAWKILREQPVFNLYCQPKKLVLILVKKCSHRIDEIPKKSKGRKAHIFLPPGFVIRLLPEGTAHMYDGCFLSKYSNQGNLSWESRSSQSDHQD